MGAVRLVPLDPFDGKTGLLVPFVLERVRKMAGERASESDPGAQVANIARRVYSGDPSIILLGFLDERSLLVGHGVAGMETDGVETWVFISQVGMDPGDWGDVVPRAIEQADTWAEWYSTQYLVPRGMKPVTKMLMASHRSDKAWHKKFGFRLHRYVMERDIKERESA